MHHKLIPDTVVSFQYTYNTEDWLIALTGMGQPLILLAMREGVSRQAK